LEDPHEILAQGMRELSLPYDASQLERLLNYQVLLEKWNRTYNLTAIRGSEKILKLHLLDSLTVLPYLRGRDILDVGTGAGLPGIPLAVMCPQRAFFLLDSNAKKIRFVQQVAIELKLDNVRIIRTRLETFTTEQKFGTIVSRAVATLPGILAHMRRLLADDGVILLFKGQSPTQDLEQLEQVRVEAIQLKIPGMNVQRHLMRITT
jgi:16S rRNA (guanine527-N7)-methyltransferase